MKTINTDILRKLPLEFQNSKIKKQTAKPKLQSIPSNFYQSQNIINENFHRPISKCFII